MNARVSPIVPAALAALLGCASAQAQLPAGPPPVAGTRLDIAVEGSVARTPDLATISAGVVTDAATAGEAMQENARRMAATLAALKSAGIPARDIQTAMLTLSPQYRYQENKPPLITGYQASNQVSVRFRDLKLAGPILDRLVAQGANQISGPNLSVDSPDAALDEARTAAVTTARKRAELYARAAGLHVKRIIAISEGGGSTPTPYPMVMAMREKAADTAIEPGEQTLSIALTVSFELE